MSKAKCKAARDGYLRSARYWKGLQDISMVARSVALARYWHRKGRQL